MHALLFLLATVVADDAKAAPDSASPPNIVLFLADDLGWKDVGYHGSEIKTPHIDRLAKTGVQLNQFYVQPVCSPTRSSLMTGRYPIRQGLQVAVIWPWATWGLPLDERTLPAALKEAGYHTAITGKWHLGAHAREFLPRQRGFDVQYGHYLGAIDYFTHSRMDGLDWHRNGQALREEGYTTNLIGKEAEAIVRGHDKKKPLFLYVPFNAPHTPLQSPDEYLARYVGIKNKKRRTYAAMVACLDDAIGRVVAALDECGMRKNTLILFSSDNGGPTRHGANNDPLRGAKGSLYEGGVRVPALVNWPGRLPEGRVLNETMHIVDWYPTLLRVAGASLAGSKKQDGLDMWPTLAEGRPSPRQEILHNLTPSNGALRQGPWKLVVHKRQMPNRRKVELFNLKDDPNETTNLADKQPARVKTLTARLEQYAQEAQKAKGIGFKIPAGFKAPKVWGDFTESKK